MGLKLAKLLEGEKEYLYGQNDDFWVELGVLSKKLHGGWEPDFDEMAGTLSWRKKGSEWSFLATPNWDGANNTPVTVQKDDEDVSSYAISFSIDVKKSPSENAAAYIARVVVPTINRIEHGGFESKLRLGAVLGEATDPVAGWIPVTDKIMKHLYFKVSGKLADNKIACAWRGNGVGYAVVAPSDAERAKALVAGVLYLDKHESKLRLNQVLSEEDMTPDIGESSISDAKRQLVDFMAKKGYKYDSLSVKTTGFSDLARSSATFVTIKGLHVTAGTWTVMVQDIKRFGKENGFFVDFTGIVKDGQPVVTAESGPGRLSAILNEEDMTPGIGDKVGRPDLGAYGKDATKYIRQRKAEGDVPQGKSAVRGLRAAIKSAEEDMTPDIGKRMGRPDLGAYGRRKSEGQSISFKNKDAFRVLYDKGEVHSATDNSAFTRKPSFDTLAADVEVSDNPEGTVTFRSKDGKKFISIDQHPEKAYGYKKGEAVDRHAALEDAIKQASDMLKPRRDAKGRLILVGEEAEGFSGKIAADFADLISDVEDVKRKPWMKDALISHLSTSYKHPRKDAEEFVNAYFSGKTEAGLANFGGKKAEPFEKEEAELPSAPEYAKLVFDFMKKKGNTFDAKAWQEAVDMKGVGVPMHLWSVVKGLVQKMFLGEV